jgi:hypothetical protein
LIETNSHEKIWHHLAAMGWGFFFLYFIIIYTQHPPLGYALSFVRIFEATVKWLIYVAAVIAALFFIFS